MSALEDRRASIIVPARNSEDELGRLFACLRVQTAPRESFEVIVVDDGSDDATADVARAEPEVQLLEIPSPVGPYPARNVAAATARGDLLAFTDADCLPAPEWVERAVAAFDDPSVDLVAGGIRIPLGDSPSAVAMIDAARHLDQELYASRGYGATANMWTRRSTFEEIGGFNEAILSGGDWEFGTRAREAGKKLEYVPNAVVDHPPRERVRELARKGYRIGQGMAQLRAHADGDLRNQRVPWTTPRTYLPDTNLLGARRLEAAGHAPGRAKLAQLLFVQHLFLTMPMNYGGLVGTLRERRSRRKP